MGLSQHLEVNKGLDYKKVQTANPQHKRRQVIAKVCSKDNIMIKNIEQHKYVGEADHRKEQAKERNQQTEEEFNRVFNLEPFN